MAAVAGDEDNDGDANNNQYNINSDDLGVMMKSLAVATHINTMEAGHRSSKLSRSNQFWMNGRGETNMLWQKRMPNQSSILC